MEKRKSFSKDLLVSLILFLFSVGAVVFAVRLKAPFFILNRLGFLGNEFFWQYKLQLLIVPFFVLCLCLGFYFAKLAFLKYFSVFLLSAFYFTRTYGLIQFLFNPPKDYELEGIILFYYIMLVIFYLALAVFLLFQFTTAEGKIKVTSAAIKAALILGLILNGFTLFLSIINLLSNEGNLVLLFITVIEFTSLWLLKRIMKKSADIRLGEIIKF